MKTTLFVILAILVAGSVLVLFFPSSVFIIASLITSTTFWQVVFWIVYFLIIVACIVGMIAFVRQWGGAEEWKFFK